MKWLVCRGCGWTARISEANWRACGGHDTDDVRCEGCRWTGGSVSILNTKREAVTEWKDWREYAEREAQDRGPFFREPDWKYDEHCFTLIERVLAVRVDCPTERREAAYVPIEQRPLRGVNIGCG